MVGRKPWALLGWRKKRAEHIKSKSCEWCGSKEYLTIDHLDVANTLSDEEYLSFKNTIILCRRCAFARRKGMDLCPTCRKRYKKRIYTQCWTCAGKPAKGELKARIFGELAEEDYQVMMEIDKIRREHTRAWAYRACAVGIFSSKTS